MGFNERDMVGHSGPKPEHAQFAKLREALSRVEAATGPMDINDAQMVCKLVFSYAASGRGVTEEERRVTDSRIDLRAGLQGSLDAVVALVEREMPGWGWGTIAWHNMQLVEEKNRVRASLIRYGVDGIPDGMMVCAYAETELKARRAAFLRAMIAEAEQAGQRAGKAS